MNINFRILVEKLTGGVTNGIYFKRGCFNYYNFMHSNLFPYIFVFSFCHQRISLAIIIFSCWFQGELIMSVDILMATYNGGRHLRNQLLSLQQQTYEDWTLWVSR